MDINLKLDLINVRLSRIEMRLEPLIGAKLYFYEPETTLTKASWMDEGFDITNPHPVIADGRANFPDCFVDGPYKVELRDADDLTLFIKEGCNGN